MQPRKRQSFQRRLLAWYIRNRRPLPWRKTRNPYHILVSEIMLQQTQVDRVWPFYQRFLKRFPTFQKLARARRAEVLRYWSGLGYNRRAINLHRLAQEVSEKHSGKLPRTAEELQKLPGIGPYTAAAITTFAFGAHGAFVETNVRRVIGRSVLKKHFPTPREDKKILRVAGTLVPQRKAAIWHHALMDLGALICLPRPRCDRCPLRTICLSYPAILKNPQARLKQPRELFEDSNRYWRGKILKALLGAPRDKILTRAALHQEVTRNTVRLSSRRLLKLLTALQSEGLVTVTKRNISLAGL